MKILFLIIAVFLIAGCSEPAAVATPQPHVASVVIQDGRSVCQKKVDMAFIARWDKQCSQEDKDSGCDLNDVMSVNAFRDAGYNFCK